MQSIKLFEEKFSFLKLLPNELLFKLSTDEFYFPNTPVNKARKELEIKLDAYVMTYKSDVFIKNIPIDIHLCANLAGADLSEKQTKLLKNYEKLFRAPKISFVAYRKPLMLIKPEKSPMSSLA